MIHIRLSSNRLPLAVLAASTALTLSCASPTFAAPVVGTNPVTGAVSISGTHDLRITLTRGNPEIDAPELQGEVAGVTIVLHRLTGISPKDAADMQRVASTDLSKIQAQWPRGLRLESKTDGNGVAVFSGLPEGIYLVTSESPDNGTTYRTIEPFLVSIPFHVSQPSGQPIPGVIIAKSSNEDPSTPTTTPPVTTPTTIPSTTATTTPATPTLAIPSDPQRSPGIGAATGVQIAGALMVAAGLILGVFLLIGVLRRRHSDE